VAFFTDLISDIDQSFQDILPKHFCIPCFIKGLLEGVAVGALAVAGLAALAAAAPLAATVAAVALAAVGIAGLASLVSSWKGMSDQQKSEALGGLVGGALTGRLAGGTTVGVPTLSTVSTSGGAATLELVIANAAISAPAATAAGAGIGTGAAMMMSSGSGGGGNGSKGSGDEHGKATGVEIVDAEGNPIGEFDEVHPNKFVEDKSAKGLNTPHPKTGKPVQTPDQWAQKQVYDKTVVRIENLENRAVATRSTTGGSSSVPSLSDIKQIHHLEFRIQDTTPELKVAVDKQISALKTKYPGWTFDATFGP
jgi:hypothetical protein